MIVLFSLNVLGILSDGLAILSRKVLIFETSLWKLEVFLLEVDYNMNCC